MGILKFQLVQSREKESWGYIFWPCAKSCLTVKPLSPAELVWSPGLFQNPGLEWQCKGVALTGTPKMRSCREGWRTPSSGLSLRNRGGWGLFETEPEVSWNKHWSHCSVIWTRRNGFDALCYGLSYWNFQNGSSLYSGIPWWFITLEAQNLLTLNFFPRESVL